MIDLNTLILNSCRVADTGDTAQPEIKSDELVIKEESNENDTLLTPGAFMLLLTELFEKKVVDDEAANETNVSEPGVLEKKSDAQQLGDNKAAAVDENDDEAVTGIRSEQSLDPQQIDANQLNQTAVIAVTPNVALTWIDYEHFEPPLTVAMESIDAEQFLSGVDKSINPTVVGQTKETTPYSGPIIAEEEGAGIDNNELTQQSALFDYEEPFVQNINQHNTDSFEAFAESSGMVTSLLDKGVETATITQPSEHRQSLIQPELVTNQTNPNTPESIKPKMLDIPVSLNDSQWADQFSEHIIWLGHQGVKTAVIKLNPEDLGPLEISVKVVKEFASVNIISHSNHVRDIVEQAMPRLREMMADQGLDLADVTYGTGSGADARQSEHQNNDTKNEMMFEMEEGALVTSLTKKSPKGLIDYFA
ncbi:flagellar hook-length control protein FliK [uncultured Legionella sp.]|uniref:flagellar hook-length control protein FliK n=1 Tax=uncultured Legionella sp. TaxID=210934 RepID=UPI00262E4DBB|nr:flagellar hook-length control protein FliK [uncultured Legionella sp.]